MHLSEFILLVVATIAAIAAGLAVVASNYRVARALFGLAALSFGSLGLVWAANSDASLVKQMLVAGIVGGIASAGFAYGLWELRGKELAPSPEAQHDTPAAPVVSQPAQTEHDRRQKLLNELTAKLLAERPDLERNPDAGMAWLNSQLEARGENFRWRFIPPGGVSNLTVIGP